jgi:mono/diheme cytochrome c family protein
MNNLRYFILVGIVATIIPFLESCSPAGGNNTGHEYMPDMAHPISYETNVYDDYSYNSWNNQSVVDRKTLSNPRMPINGTIPRGYVGYSEEKMTMFNGSASNSSIRTPMNGNVPYYFADTEEERKRAELEYCKVNPFPITTAGLARGKELFETYCGVSCHGKAANGQGWLVSEENKASKYPAQPANFIKDEFYAAGNGRFYHAIMYGKNVMQQHRDKLSFEERWQVIHYIRSLQAASKQLKYDENENTFAPAIATPYAVIAKAKAEAAAKIAAAQPKVEATKTPAEGEHATEAHGGGHEGHHKK